MKHYLQSILIVLIAMIISAFLIFLWIYGIYLVAYGMNAWQVVEEMGELLLVK